MLTPWRAEGCSRGAGSTGVSGHLVRHLQIHENMEGSNVAAAFMEANMKETSNSTEDYNSNNTDMKNGDITLVDAAADLRSIESLAEDEENSDGMVFIAKELNVGLSSDKKESQDVTPDGSEASSLPTPTDEAVQDLQALSLPTPIDQDAQDLQASSLPTPIDQAVQDLQASSLPTSIDQALQDLQASSLPTPIDQVVQDLQVSSLPTPIDQVVQDLQASSLPTPIDQVAQDLQASSLPTPIDQVAQDLQASSLIVPMDQAAQDQQAQEDELRELGINVVDQLSLERNVEAAVDKVVTMHARKQRFQILKKEIKDIQMERKQAEMKMQSLRNRVAGMRQRVVDPRMYFKVEEEVKTKTEQLKTLRARENFLQQKLASATTNEEELDDLELEEGEIPDTDDVSEQDIMDDKEREKLIREGQMTPFGTVSTASKTVSFPRPVKPHSKEPISVRKKVASKEAAKAEMISRGEMTPFGTIIRPSDSDSISGKQSGAAGKFEQYLQDQINRQKHRSVSGKDVHHKKSSGDPSYGVPKKKRKLKEYVGIYDSDKTENSTKASPHKKKAKGAATGKKDPLKKRILHPKKRKKEKVSGTITSTSEADQLKLPPRRLLSERMSLEESDYDSKDEGSGSEYVPSDHESPDLMEESDDNFESEAAASEKRIPTAKGRKRKKKLDEDSDEMLSEDDIPKTKRKTLKSKDDGNLDDYLFRIEAWKKERLKRKQSKILRGEDLDSDEEEEEGYEQFTGGYKVPLMIWNKLYKYQQTCVRWLWELHSQGCGGILGDEMGLGKTIQIISFLVGLSYSGLNYRRQRWKGLGPVLVVCPATVLHQWVKEFHKWWPPFRVAVLHESGSFVGKRPALIHNINSYCGILVTSYTGVRDQLETLLQYDWHYIILDEGHKIRNPEAQITVALKRFQTPHRLILSGSPIQNSLKELWSLFDYVFPGKLGTLPVFLQQFAVPITQGGYANATKLEVQTAFKCASMLRDTINPFLLRRMKNDVRSHLSLPDKNEQVLFCGLSDEQRKIYQEYLNGDQVKAIVGGRAKVFVGLINLRKICNHPDLYTGGPRGEDMAWDSGLQPELRYGWWSRSGKMHVLRSILRLWSQQSHRVLLFTQSCQMMCILEKFLMDEGYSYLKMDGATAVSSRQPLIEKFNTDSSYFVFLLTTRVGGLGVNLTGADRVIIFDPDWNPSTDAQARERAWRIGQLRNVTIYRLLMAGTIEEKIYHRQIFKQFLTNRVLKDPKQQRFFKTNDLYELFSLTEGEKEKTESSAIFAGTGSEIKLGVRKSPKKIDLSEILEDSYAPKKRAPLVKKDTGKTQYKNGEKIKRKSSERLDDKGNDCSGQIKPSQVEKMKELAKLLSQKIGTSKKSQNESSSGLMTVGEASGSKEAKGNTDDSNVASQSNDAEMEVDIKKTENSNEENTYNCASENLIPDKTKTLHTEAVTNSTEDTVSQGDSSESTVKNNSDDAAVNKILENDKKESKLTESILFKALSVSQNTNKNKEQKSQSDLSRTNSESGTGVTRHKGKHKKKNKVRDKEKHKESKKKGKRFEGERIEFLVKKRKFRKTEEEEKEEQELSKSQDQYVLEKLFRKSGIHGALSHDAIMNSNDADYLLVEGEAERVAKEALKAVRASRSRCFRPLPRGDTTQSPAKSTPKFGKKKSQVFDETPSAKGSKSNDENCKENKVPMFSGGFVEKAAQKKITSTIKEDDGHKSAIPLSDQGEGSSGMLSSSQLLSRMRQRNRGIALDSEDEDGEGYNPDYPSTATVEEESLEPEVQENIDLLADIRNFVAFQAEVDGQASTQEILARFKERLPPSQTPFFKALLTQICDFHRESSGKGIWSLKGEFR